MVPTKAHKIMSQCSLTFSQISRDVLLPIGVRYTLSIAIFAMLALPAKVSRRVIPP